MPLMFMEPTNRQITFQENKFDEKTVLEHAKQDITHVLRVCEEKLPNSKPHALLHLVRIEADAAHQDQILQIYLEAVNEENRKLRQSGTPIHLSITNGAGGEIYFVAGTHEPVEMPHMAFPLHIDLSRITPESYAKVVEDMAFAPEEKKQLLKLIPEIYASAEQGELDLANVVIDRTAQGCQIEQPEKVPTMANAKSILLGQDQLTDKEMQALEKVKLSEEDRAKLKLTEDEISKLMPSQIHDRQWDVLYALFQDLSQELHHRPFSMIGQDEQIRLLWMCFRLTKTDKYQPVGFVERSGSSEELYKAGEAISRLAGDCDDMSMVFAAAALRLREKRDMKFEEISIVWAVYQKLDENKEAGHANTYVRIGKKSNHFVELTNEPKIVKFSDAESFDEKWMTAASISENDKASVDKLLFEGQNGVEGYYWFTKGRESTSHIQAGNKLETYLSANTYFEKTLYLVADEMKKDIRPFVAYSLLKAIEFIRSEEEKQGKIEELDEIRIQLKHETSKCTESELYRGLSLVGPKEKMAGEILLKVYEKQPWNYLAAEGLGKFYVGQTEYGLAEKYFKEADAIRQSRTK